MTLRKLLLPLILLSFMLVACGTNDESANEPLVVTVDVETIADAVMNELPTPETIDAAEIAVVAADSIDTNAIAEEAASQIDVGAIAAEVATQVEVPQPEPNPTVDTGEIVASVLESLEGQISAEIADQIAAQPMPITNPDSPAQAFGGESVQTALIDVYANVNPSVVFIINPGSGSGSGFVYDLDGNIVTNNHVIEGNTNYEVVFSNGERREAVLVGADPDSDLAVIRVTSLPEDIGALALADPTQLQVGEFVVAIGNPFGEQGSMSLGIVSGLGRSLSSQRTLPGGNSYALPAVIQTDAPINPGNSGGPLLNLQGQVVGVNAAIATETGANSGVGFSIPVAAVWQMVPSLIEFGEYNYPFMGLGFDGDISLDEQQVYGLPQTQGAYVLSLTPGGPADLAGIQAANQTNGQGGDLIIQINDTPINDFDDLNAFLVFNSMANDTIDMTIIRDGETITIPLTLGTRP